MLFSVLNNSKINYFYVVGKYVYNKILFIIYFKMIEWV